MSRRLARIAVISGCCSAAAFVPAGGDDMGQESAAPPVRSSTTSCLVQPNYTRFEPPFADMVVFGDTLTDVGNSLMYGSAVSGGFQGRFADGLTWIEYVQRHLRLPELYASMNGGTNYAYGGATTDSDFIKSLDGVPSISEQVTEYLESMEELSPDILHVIMAGRSDYLRYVETGLVAEQEGTGAGDSANHTHVYFTVASEVIRQVQRLYDAGGRQFLVGNVPSSISRGKDDDVYGTLLFGHNSFLSTELEVSSAELDSFQREYLRLCVSASPSKLTRIIETIQRRTATRRSITSTSTMRSGVSTNTRTSLGSRTSKIPVGILRRRRGA